MPASIEDIPITANLHVNRHLIIRQGRGMVIVEDWLTKMHVSQETDEVSVDLLNSLIHSLELSLLHARGAFLAASRNDSLMAKSVLSE